MSGDRTRIEEILREFAERIYGDLSTRDQEDEIRRAADALLALARSE